ncbi:unnamed protein product [Symbiodinium pilosum]|uniref:Uncharacterized protein n=1 Tax=Symbiodinium pilosum TaxID=2952 RepID=A0A812K5P9_SYMPI|nr:unnamed protein product [Symbiodinium pilosum]
MISHSLQKKVLSACQAWRLLSSVVFHGVCMFCSLILALLRIPFAGQENCAGVEFFEGHVTHTRSHEASHAFKYPVRMALVDLDTPPDWWKEEPIPRLSAKEVREALGVTSSRVRVLTTPSSAGYHQNPIQIYYCGDEKLHDQGICEVTNTPWNHHVFFVFDRRGAELPKPLHVSPLMDLQHRWQIRASDPSSEILEVSVDVLPGLERGSDSPPIFRAHLRLKRSPMLRARAERAGSLRMLWEYGFQPQRTAVRIYVNAIKLLRALGST